MSKPGEQTVLCKKCGQPKEESRSASIYCRTCDNVNQHLEAPVPSAAPVVTERNYSDPTPRMLDDPLWNVIWAEIKSWDINIPSEYRGYCGANGNHVTAIYKAIINWRDPAEAEVAQPVPDAVVSQPEQWERDLAWAICSSENVSHDRVNRLMELIRKYKLLASPTPVVSGQAERYTIQGAHGEGYRVTDTNTDSRVATCFLMGNAKMVCDALNMSERPAPPSLPKAQKCPACDAEKTCDPITRDCAAFQAIPKAGETTLTYDKEEWRDFATEIKPELTDEEFDSMWERFAELKRKKGLQ